LRSTNEKSTLYRIVKKIWRFAKRISYEIVVIRFRLFKPRLLKKNKSEPMIVVSFTTYPARINSIPFVVGSLVRQTKLPDEIVIYLSKKQFKDLNHPAIKKVEKQGAKVVLCDGDLRSHKKYFYAMQEYRDAIVITVDDDIIYERHMIEDLYRSYRRHPGAVSAKRVHQIQFDEKGNVRPYKEWKYDIKRINDSEAYDLVATGCGGVLYPPNSLDLRFLDIQGIENCCPYADDLWLKIMELLRNTPVVLAESNNYRLKHIWNTDTEGLAIDNINNGGNDSQLEKICKYFHVNLYEWVKRTENCSWKSAGRTYAK
jgi:hypothetical protein